jgi:uncharacterized protein YjbI with pentapeptide repeats
VTLLELLQAGKIEDFNNQRGVHNAPTLYAEDLAGLDLRGADLNGANLEKADLSESDLRGVNLSRANLNGADLTEAKLQGAVCVQTKLRGAYIDQADLDNADLTGADLREAVLTGSDGPGAVFTRAKLREANMKEAKLTGAIFTEARMENADLSGAYLEGCNFSEASLGGASLEGAHLEGAIFTAARAANVSFQKAKLMGANFERCDLTAAALDGADLTGANMKEADLTEATLDGANLEGVEMRGAALGGDAADAAPAEEALPESPAQIVAEDLRGAVKGSHVALLWENEEDGTSLANRLAVLKQGQEFDGVAPALAGPAEITLARDVVDHGDGFAAVLLLERPTGVELQVTWLGTDGSRKSQVERLGYEAAVRPMILGGDALRIVGLGRRGPTLHILKVVPEGGVEVLSSVKATTARGLIGGLHPVLLTRGGAVHMVTDTGLSAPLKAPPGFELRAATACVHEKQVTLAWLPQDKKGLTYSVLEPGERPETLVTLKTEVILAVDLFIQNGQPAAYVVREDPSRGGGCGVWRVDLTEHDAKPVDIFNHDKHDIETMRVIGVDGDAVTMLCTTLTEEVLVLRSTGGKAKVLCTL